MPERFVREATSDRVARNTSRTVRPAPRIRLGNPTFDHRPVWLEQLSDGFKSELVEGAERGQVRGREGSVEHVKVFRMGSVGPSILEDLDAYPAIAARIPTTPSSAKSRVSPFDSMPLRGGEGPWSTRLSLRRSNEEGLASREGCQF